jgi:hypothetical protein
VEDIYRKLQELSYDPDFYFYLRLSRSHVIGVEPFFKEGECVLLSIRDSENHCMVGDLCMVSYETFDEIKIFGYSENIEFYVLNSCNMKLPPLVLKKDVCKIYKIIEHIRDI